jgi:plastocyanin
MKKIYLAFFLVFLSLLIMPVRQLSAAPTLANALKGRILLQVEAQGQAWYVEPQNGMRAYLGRPSNALDVMRAVGLGITNADLNRIAQLGSLDTDRAFAQRLSGRILLQVQGQGQAWYVYPVNLKRYYLGRPTDALSVMRQLGLGITNEKLVQIPENLRFRPASSDALISYATIANSTFSPTVLLLNKGDAVIWTNKDKIAHTITETSHPGIGFSSGQLAPGATFSHVFTASGTYAYKCSNHPTMTGKVIIR